MSYLSIINSFWDSATTNPLSTGQVSLYMALLHVCNRSSWAEWFQAPNQVLSVLTGLSRSGILKARNELKQRGLIDFRERGTKATLYRITIADSKQAGVQDGKRAGKQAGKQAGVQNSGTLKDIERDREKENPPVSPIRLFDDFLAAYPKKASARPGAEYAYCRALREDSRITEQDLVAAAANYAEEVRILGREEEFIRKPESFLKDSFFAGYLPGQYERPKTGAGKGQKKNSFNRFQQNEYDFAALEDELVSN